MKREKTSPARTSPHEDPRRKILEHLAALSITMTQEELDDLLRQAEQASWSHVELLDRLLGERAQGKRQRTVERRIREARFVMGMSLLYKVIDRRNMWRSTALVTNVDFDAWNDYLGDAVMTMALLDRLADSAITLKINGKSYRVHRARQVGPASDGGRAKTGSDGQTSD
jgi:DNA replication protein DnaC